MILYKDESEDEASWKLHLISSGSWKFINIKIWNARSTIVFVWVTQYWSVFKIFLSSEYAIELKNNKLLPPGGSVYPPGGFSSFFFDQGVP